MLGMAKLELPADRVNTSWRLFSPTIRAISGRGFSRTRLIPDAISVSSALLTNAASDMIDLESKNAAHGELLGALRKLI
jgi:hypothetical protein